MMTNKTNARIFAVCALVLLWSFLSVSSARADQNQFSDNGDGTIYDAKTGLTWQKEGLNGLFTWQEALEYAESLNIGACGGWHLPTSKELKRIVDHHKGFTGPALINSDYFPNTAADFYWSSSSHKNTLKYAISFANGQQKKKASSNTYHVRAVRGDCDPADNDGDGYTPAEGDCNDNDPSINPGAVEMCDDGVDSNCDGEEDYSCWDVDNDLDGQTENGGDCDDRDPNNFSGNTEVCDGADNDCDTVADNGLNFDVDLDGYFSATSCPYTGANDCNDDDANIHPGATEECDAEDNNCDGSIDENLTQATTCGVGACTGNVGEETCDFGEWVDDCDPDAGATAEVCDNIDNNCDGSIDEDLTQATSCGVGECGAAGIETCTAGAWGGNTCIPGTPSAEICDNLDNNCDGTIDEYLTQATSCGVGECSSNTGEETCSAGVWGGDTCNPLAGATVETCDGLDNNCDGQTDEGVTLTFYYDADVDTFGSPTNTLIACSASPGFVSNSGDCNDTDAAINPDALEVCDEVDNNCDTVVDEGCSPVTNTVKLEGVDYYDTVQVPYDIITSGGNGTIKAQALTFTESLIFDRDVIVALVGGFDEFFTASTGYTTISNPGGPALIIRNGRVNIKNIILR